MSATESDEGPKDPECHDPHMLPTMTVVHTAEPGGLNPTSGCGFGTSFVNRRDSGQEVGGILLHPHVLFGVCASNVFTV